MRWWGAGLRVKGGGRGSRRVPAHLQAALQRVLKLAGIGWQGLRVHKNATVGIVGGSQGGCGQQGGCAAIDP